MEGSVTDEQAHVWLQEIADAAYVSLHFDSPALGGDNLAEISGGGYVRAHVPFSSPANRAIWSLEDARFTGLMQNRLTYFGIWNAVVKGRLMAYAPLEEPATILNGFGYVLHEGDLAVSIG